MKRLTALVLTGALVLCAGCGSDKNDSKDTTVASQESTTVVATEATTEETTESTTEVVEPDFTVMSYDEYAAAEMETEVTVLTYVQAKQSWWEDKATVYSQDENGAYFIYNMACSEEDYEALVPGTPILVTGFKSEWEGEVEIVDATFTFVDGEAFVANAYDVTDDLDTENIVNYQNQLVSFTGMTVEPANEDGAAFLYNWDGSGKQGDDLYFNVSYNGTTYSFTVESYLCGSDTDVYKAVEALNVGDVIDMEGFLYWYQGVNPHITMVSVQ